MVEDPAAWATEVARPGHLPQLFPDANPITPQQRYAWALCVAKHWHLRPPFKRSPKCVDKPPST
jgi:hypothetical protein